MLTSYTTLLYSGCDLTFIVQEIIHVTFESTRSFSRLSRDSSQANMRGIV